MRTITFPPRRPSAPAFPPPMVWGSRRFLLATLEAADDARVAGNHRLADALVDEARAMKAAA